MVRKLTFLVLAVMLCHGAAGQAAGKDDTRVLRTAEYRALQKKLCQGWNTWSANSVLAHVHLPDAFALNLGLKSAGYGPMYQNAFFSANETLHRPERVRLGPHADDGSFTELTVGWKVAAFRPDSNNVLLIQSASEDDQEYILITVQQRDALRPLHLIVEAGFYWNRPGTVERDGQILRARSGLAGGRTYEVRATAPDIQDSFVTANTPYLSVVLDGQLAIYTGPEKTLDAVKTIKIRTARSSWQSWQPELKPAKSSPPCRASWPGI